MAFLTRLGAFVLDVLRPDTELSPELRAYCRSEGVDPQSLRKPDPDPKPTPRPPSPDVLPWTPCQDDGTCVDSA